MLAWLGNVLRSFAAAENKTGWTKRKIANRLARRHIRRAWQEYAVRAPTEQTINEEFDRRHGTETAAEVLLVETGVPAEDAVNGRNLYRPVWESEFHDTLAVLDLDFEGFTFVDIGSGKGKALMMAADYPFARVIGVEFSPGLHAIAQRNLHIYRSPAQRCSDLASIHVNALDYRLPEGPLICLVFNSFDAETMRRYIRTVEADLVCRSAPAYLLYANLRHVAEIGDGLDGIKGLRRIVNTRKAVAFANAAAARRRQAGRQWINQPSANTTKAITPEMSQRAKARIPPDGDSVASAGSSGL